MTTLSAPRVSVSFSRSMPANGLNAPPVARRQLEQWQFSAYAKLSSTAYSTAPQRHLPLRKRVSVKFLSIPYFVRNKYYERSTESGWPRIDEHAAAWACRRRQLRRGELAVAHDVRHRLPR